MINRVPTKPELAIALAHARGEVKLGDALVDIFRHGEYRSLEEVHTFIRLVLAKVGK